MSTINRICELQGWSDAKVIQLLFEYLEAQGQLHEALDWLQAVAVDENEDYYQNVSCPSCSSTIDSHGFCTNPICGYYGFFEEGSGGLRPLCQDSDMQATSECEAMPVVANTRSKRYYIASDKAYVRAARARHVCFFTSEAEARAAGFHRGGP